MVGLCGNSLWQNIATVLTVFGESSANTSTMRSLKEFKSIFARVRTLFFYLPFKFTNGPLKTDFFKSCMLPRLSQQQSHFYDSQKCGNWGTGEIIHHHHTVTRTQRRLSVKR